MTADPWFSVLPMGALEHPRVEVAGPVCVVLPAAGVGERMNLLRPKQFCDVVGRPLISYTIESFEKIPWIAHIIVVISPDYLQLLQEILVKYLHKRVTVVEGALTRHRSIYNGVIAVEKVCNEASIVIIHDSVRPFVDESTIRDVVNAASQSGAAGMVRPLVSTVVATDLEGYLDHSLDRSKYRASEMPQAFALEVIKRAYASCTDYDLDYGTECLHLAQRYAGAKVRLIDGPEHLWKVTYRRDLFAVEGEIKAASRVALVFREKCSDVIEEILKGSLHRRLGTNDAFVSCCYEDFGNICGLKQFPNSVIICHSRFSTSEDIISSTDVVLKLHQPCSVQSVAIIHLLVMSEFRHDKSILAIMSSVKICQRANAVVNAVLSSQEDLHKASDIITSLSIDRNCAFNGQTFQV